MKKKRAYQIAIAKIEAAMQDLAPDANLYLQYKADGPHFQSAYNEYRTLAEAVAWFHDDLKQTNFLGIVDVDKEEDEQ